MKSQLAARLEVPECKELGLMQWPPMKHHRQLRPGRHFHAFLCVCVSFLSPTPDIRGESPGEHTKIREAKFLRESTLWSPKGKAV